ncbi:MAG: DJ-1/PfpI family protein [Verrucomicrobia bacterium]|nr:DJ-1/PfpI family protein [Verrucomicrobiota bacterium]
MPRVLTLLAEGFEEIETVAPVDLLRRAGAEVTLASLADAAVVTGRCGIGLKADFPLEAITPDLFDCLLLPGGPGVRHLRADPRVRDLVRRHYDGGKWLAAICAAPTVLLDAGILPALRHTAHPSVASELPNRLVGEKVVVDRNIITSRGAGTAVEFGLKIVEMLFSTEKSAEIGRSICV